MDDFLGLYVTAGSFALLILFNAVFRRLGELTVRVGGLEATLAHGGRAAAAAQASVADVAPAPRETFAWPTAAADPPVPTTRLPADHPFAAAFAAAPPVAPDPRSVAPVPPPVAPVPPPVAPVPPPAAAVPPPVSPRYKPEGLFDKLVFPEAEPATPRTEGSRPESEPEVAVAASTGAAPGRAVSTPAINWELFAGGRLLNVIGAIILVIGVGSLLKYAWDENWVSAPLRIAAGIIAGIALLGCGHVSHVRAKSKWFEHGLFGAGLGTLYVSGYGAFAGYHLVPFAVAYGYMSVVTIVAFALSVWYESLPMALIGWAAGFVTPFAISDRNENPIGLASYIVLLDIGLVAVSLVRRGWFALQPLALVASYAVTFSWYSEHAAEVSPLVSTIALLSIWFVFFMSGVADTLRELTQGAQSFAFLRRATAIANGVIFWVYLHAVLRGETTALAWTMLGTGAAYAIAYLLFVRRAPQAHFERFQYALGAAALLAAATLTEFHRFEPVTLLALEGTLVAAVALGWRRAGADLAVAREGAIVSFALWACGALAALVMPESLLFGGHSWDFAFGARDLSFVTLFAAALLLERLSSRAQLLPWFGVMQRQLSLLVLACIESVHFAAFELSACYVADALAVTLLDRALRRFGKRYAPAPEPAIVSLALLLFGVLAFTIAPGAFALANGSWDGTFGARDLALLAIVAGGFLLDRLVRGEAGLAPLAMGYRQIALGAIVALDIAHAGNLGLVALFALESIGLVAIDRVLAKFGRSYAPGHEPLIVATAFGLFGWLTFVFVGPPLVYGREPLALGFGGVDAALLGLVVASLCIGRAYRTALGPAGRICLRQSAVIALVFLPVVHVSGVRLGEAFSIEALMLALIGTRAMLRDLEIAGFAFLTFAAGAVLTSPAAWHAEDIFRFVPFADERFYAILLTSVATIVAGEVYRRRSTLPSFLARAERIAGLALATFGLTVEVRDAFELAIAHARLLPGTPENLALLARLANGEGLGISGVWLAVSIVLVAVGIRFRVREFRITAIGLFDLTILKAFFIDLSSLETPYRIISFIGLGLVLLGISYVYQRLERGYFDRPPDPSLAAQASGG